MDTGKQQRQQSVVAVPGYPSGGWQSAIRAPLSVQVRRGVHWSLGGEPRHTTAHPADLVDLTPSTCTVAEPKQMGARTGWIFTTHHH